MTGFLVKFKGYYDESGFVIIEDKEVESVPAVEQNLKQVPLLRES